MRIKNLFLAAISVFVVVLAGSRLTAFDKAGVVRNVSVALDDGRTNEL